jgi:hypothetical protein
MAKALAILGKMMEEAIRDKMEEVISGQDILKWAGIFVLLYLLMLVGLAVHFEGGVVDCLGPRLTFAF